MQDDDSRGSEPVLDLHNYDRINPNRTWHEMAIRDQGRIIPRGYARSIRYGDRTPNRNGYRNGSR